MAIPPPIKKSSRYVAPGEIISRWRPFIFVKDTSGRRLIVYWRRTALYLAALTLTLWLSAAGVLCSVLSSRHHFPDLSYFDIVLPWRWDDYRQKLGRHYIGLGRQALKENHLADAVWNIRAGLARFPTDWEARCELAKLYASYRQPQQAASLLMERIADDWTNPAYLRLTLELLTTIKDDQEIIQLGSKLLPATPTTNPSHRYLALQTAAAFLRQGNYTRTEQLLHTWKLEQTAEGTVLLASDERECGYPELALVRLQDAAKRYPKNSQIYGALMQTLRELDQTAAAQQVALQRYAADPFNAGARIDLLAIGPLKDNLSWRDREIESYLRDYADNTPALLLLAEYSIKSNQPTVIRKVREIVSHAGQLTQLLHLMEAECLLRTPAFAEARAALTLAEDAPATRLKNLITGLRAVLAYRMQDTAGYGNVSAFISGRPAASESLKVAELFSSINEPSQAQRILVDAAKLDPTNQQIITRLVTLDIEIDDTADLKVQLRRLLALPKPPRKILEAAALKLTATIPEKTETTSISQQTDADLIPEHAEAISISERMENATNREQTELRAMIKAALDRAQEKSDPTH